MLLAINFLWAPGADCSIQTALKTLQESGCSVIESRGTQLADHQGFMLLVEGQWNQVARLESLLDAMNQSELVSVVSSRCSTPGKGPHRIPYTVDVYGADHPDVLSQIGQFLEDQQMTIEDWSSSSFQVPESNGRILNARFLVLLPAERAPLGLRDDFLSYCDQLKVDGLMEPAKR